MSIAMLVARLILLTFAALPVAVLHLILPCVLGANQQAYTLLRDSLNHCNWKLYSPTNSSLPPVHSVCCPSLVHTALQAEVVIDSAFKGHNELQQRWIGENDWVFTTLFSLSAQILEQHTILLHLSQVDTAATVTVNNTMLGRTEDSFIDYEFDLTEQVVNATSATVFNLSIHIHSPVHTSSSFASSYPVSLPGEVYPPLFLPHRSLLRKTSIDFGWDFAPALMSSGIIGGVEIRAFSGVLLDNERLLVKQQFEWTDDEAVSVAVNVTGFLQFSRLVERVQGIASLQLCHQNKLLVVDQSVQSITTSNDQRLLPFRLTVVCQRPSLWWSVGYGQPTLHTLTLSFTDIQGQRSTLQRRIGLREIKLETIDPSSQHPIYRFILNHRRLFLKGSNLVPLHALHTMVTEQHVDQVIETALQQNLNTLRLWGGGSGVQRQRLYDRADEVGLLLWYELNFACSTYPVNVEFLEVVRKEVRQWTQHLSWHPSLFAIGGNNENEFALTWYNTTKQQRDRYLADYIKLYIGTVRHELLQQFSYPLPLPFLHSSPSNGVLFESRSLYLLRFGSANDVAYGDVHYYNYEDDCEDVNMLPSAHLMSEFGWQSLPSLQTWLQMTSDQQQLYWNSSLMQHHQRHSNGSESMLQQLKRQFVVPSPLHSRHHFARLIYLTQVSQSICLTSTIDWLRLLQRDAVVQMSGVLYWQFNDVWPTISWSTVDFTRRRKVSFYGVKRALQQVRVFGIVNEQSKQVEIYWITEDDELLKGSRLRIEMRRWNDSRLVDTLLININSSLITTTLPIAVLPFNTLATQHWCQRAHCFLLLSVIDSTERVITENWCRLTKLKFVQRTLQPIIESTMLNSSFQVSDCRVEADCESCQHRFTCILHNTASMAHCHVFVESTFDGSWQQNDFFLLSQRSEPIEFVTSFSLTLDQFVKSITVAAVLGTRSVQPVSKSPHQSSE